MTLNTDQCGVNAHKCGVNTDMCGTHTDKCGVNTDKCDVNTNKCEVNTDKCGVYSQSSLPIDCNCKAMLFKAKHSHTRIHLDYNMNIITFDEKSLEAVMNKWPSVDV